MSFDFWQQSMGPFGTFLLGCAILALGVFIGGLARQHHSRRSPKAEPVRVASSVHEMGADAAVVATGARCEPRPPMPREWDGGQPKPNWNRRSG